MAATHAVKHCGCRHQQFISPSISNGTARRIASAGGEFVTPGRRARTAPLLVATALRTPAVVDRLRPGHTPRWPHQYPRRLCGQRTFLSLIHISEPTRQAEISYAVFCLKKKKK